MRGYGNYWVLKKAFKQGLNNFMVPVPRIELSAEHYHCSVLPLYYVGNYVLYLKAIIL